MMSKKTLFSPDQVRSSLLKFHGHLQVRLNQISKENSLKNSKSTLTLFNKDFPSLGGLVAGISSGSKNHITASHDTKSEIQDNNVQKRKEETIPLIHEQQVHEQQVLHVWKSKDDPPPIPKRKSTRHMKWKQTEFEKIPKQTNSPFLTVPPKDDNSTSSIETKTNMDSEESHEKENRMQGIVNENPKDSSIEVKSKSPQSAPPIIKTRTSWLMVLSILSHVFLAFLVIFQSLS